MCEHWQTSLYWSVGGGRCCWLSMCTVCLSHAKWLGEYNNESAPSFVLNFNIPLRKPFSWFRRPQTWTHGDWQLHHKKAPAHASHLVQFFGKISNHPGDSVPLQPRLRAPWFLAFPKTKITFEREEISHHWWDSGKYNREADGNWENCVRSQGTYFEGDWGVIVLYTMCLVSCILYLLQ